MVRIPTELTTRFNLHTRSKTLWLLLATPLVGNTGSVRHCSDYAHNRGISAVWARRRDAFWRAGSQGRDPARLSELAAQLVAVKVDAIVALQESLGLLVELRPVEVSHDQSVFL